MCPGPRRSWPRSSSAARSPRSPRRCRAGGYDPRTTGLGSLVMALKPGDGSAREQAASCQRVLGGCANIAEEYATKRYRSNVVNWGMLPFICAGLKDEKPPARRPGLYSRHPGPAGGRRRDEVDGAPCSRTAWNPPVTLSLPGLTREERDIILAGCLINYYARIVFSMRRQDLPRRPSFDCRRGCFFGIEMSQIYKAYITKPHSFAFLTPVSVIIIFQGVSTPLKRETCFP